MKIPFLENMGLLIGLNLMITYNFSLSPLSVGLYIIGSFVFLLSLNSLINRMTKESK